MPTVFVVNSDSSSTSVFTRLLRQAGFHTLSMTDAAMTLAVLRAIRADVFMVDLSRPQTHGPELIEKLRRDHQWAQIPIVATGARAEIDCKLLRRRVGIGAVLTEEDSSPGIVLNQVRKYVTPLREFHAQTSDERPGSLGWNN